MKLIVDYDFNLQVIYKLFNFKEYEKIISTFRDCLKISAK